MLFDQLLLKNSVGNVVSPIAPTLRPRGSVPTVVIVGAGIAGLVAAHELEACGCRVTILEARSGPGGRIATLRDADGNALAEAGAGRIPTAHDWTLHYISKMGLVTEPLMPAGLRTLGMVAGHAYTLGDDAGLAGMPALSEEERRWGIAGLASRALGPEVEQMGSDAADDRLNEWKAITVRKFLGRKGLSPTAIDLLTVGIFPQNLSLFGLLQALRHLGNGAMCRIIGGNDTLVTALADRLRGQVAFGAAVDAIEQTDKSVTVRFQQAGQKLTVVADKVICTVPYSVLDRIDFRPALSAAKHAVVSRLHYAPASKACFHMRDPFWRARGLSGFAQLEGSAEIWAPPLDTCDGSGAMQFYQQGSRAIEFDAMDEGNRLEHALRVIESLFPGAASQVMSGASVSWQTDPWSRGAYVVRTPADADLTPHAIGQAEGRVLFAGEHVSDFPGWVEGAVRSGYAAAKVVVEDGVPL